MLMLNKIKMCPKSINLNTIVFIFSKNLPLENNKYCIHILYNYICLIHIITLILYVYD